MCRAQHRPPLQGNVTSVAVATAANGKFIIQNGKHWTTNFSFLTSQYIQLNTFDFVIRFLFLYRSWHEATLYAYLRLFSIFISLFRTWVFRTVQLRANWNSLYCEWSSTRGVATFNDENRSWTTANVTFNRISMEMFLVQKTSGPPSLYRLTALTSKKSEVNKSNLKTTGFFFLFPPPTQSTSHQAKNKFYIRHTISPNYLLKCREQDSWEIYIERKKNRKKKFGTIHTRRQSVLNWIIVTESTVVEPTKTVRAFAAIEFYHSRYAHIVSCTRRGCLHTLFGTRTPNAYANKHHIYIVMVRAHITRDRNAMHCIRYGPTESFRCDRRGNAREQSFDEGQIENVLDSDWRNRCGLSAVMRMYSFSWRMPNCQHLPNDVPARVWMNSLGVHSAYDIFCGIFFSSLFCSAGSAKKWRCRCSVWFCECVASSVETKSVTYMIGPVGYPNRHQLTSRFFSFFFFAFSFRFIFIVVDLFRQIDAAAAAVVGRFVNSFRIVGHDQHEPH